MITRWLGDALDADQALAALTLSPAEQEELAVMAGRRDRRRGGLRGGEEQWLDARATEIAVDRQLPRAAAREAAEQEAASFYAGELGEDFLIP